MTQNSRHSSVLKDTVPHEPQVPEDRGIGPYVYTGCLFSALFLLITILTLIFTRFGCGQVPLYQMFWMVILTVLISIGSQVEYGDWSVSAKQCHITPSS